jgi:hypothetical protein
LIPPAPARVARALEIARAKEIVIGRAQVGRLLSPQNAIDIASGASGLVEEIGAVGDETASGGPLSA